MILAGWLYDYWRYGSFLLSVGLSLPSASNITLFAITKCTIGFLDDNSEWPIDQFWRKIDRIFSASNAIYGVDEAAAVLPAHPICVSESCHLSWDMVVEVSCDFRINPCNWREIETAMAEWKHQYVCLGTVRETEYFMDSSWYQFVQLFVRHLTVWLVEEIHRR